MELYDSIDISERTEIMYVSELEKEVDRLLNQERRMDERKIDKIDLRGKRECENKNYIKELLYRTNAGRLYSLIGKYEKAALSFNRAGKAAFKLSERTTGLENRKVISGIRERLCGEAAKSYLKTNDLENAAYTTLRQSECLAICRKFELADKKFEQAGMLFKEARISPETVGLYLQIKERIEKYKLFYKYF